MALTPLYDPSNGPMRVVGLMSGSGSNLRKIIEHERQLGGETPYQMVALFAENKESKVIPIAQEFDLPYIVRDMKEFYQARERLLRDMQVRAEFDRKTAELLGQYDAPVAAFGGYMKLATAPLLNGFICVNVHPADLSIKRDDGLPRFTGDNAVRDAIKAGEQYLRATTHIMVEKADQGPLLMLSQPIEVVRGDTDLSDPVKLKALAEQHQDQLKQAGDWIIFPQTLEGIARGRYARDETGALYFDGEKIPNGVRLEK